jgi:DNA-binding NarL/FixJ family response regulator
MLVDDHDMVSQSLRIILELEADIEVVGLAGSVAEAIILAAHCEPDVILMDYYLPDGDGIAATLGIKAERPGVKIILLTGSDDPDALQRAVDAGCLGYLDKAGPLDDLAAAVRVAAAGHAVISAQDLAQLVPGARGSGGITRLTRREREILHLMAEGLSNQEIAARLVLSVHTVRTHVQTILAKLGGHSKLEAVAIARRRRLLG